MFGLVLLSDMQLHIGLWSLWHTLYVIVTFTHLVADFRDLISDGVEGLVVPLLLLLVTRITEMKGEMSLHR